MTSFRSMALLALFASAALLSGCQTSGGSKNEQNRIRVTNGSYQSGDSSLSGDIQSILMAGGLDVSNPSAAAGTVKGPTSPAPTGIPPSTQSLVAALSAGGSTTSTTSAAQTTVAAAPAPAPVLAMVEPPRPLKKKVVFETRVENEKPQVVELASINATGSSSMEDDAFDPLPPSPQTRKPVATAPIQKSERVARIPVNEKTSRVKRF